MCVTPDGSLVHIDADCSFRACRSHYEQRKPVVWQNLIDGTYYAINNHTGDRVPCDRLGRPIPQFHRGISGVASTKMRMSLNLKVCQHTLYLVAPLFMLLPPVILVMMPVQDMALQKSLQTPDPERPSPLVGGEQVFTSMRGCM